MGGGGGPPAPGRGRCSVLERSRHGGPVRSQPVRPAGVAPSDAGAPDPGEARLLASGALVQGIAQAGGLLVLLVIVTVLARRLTVAEFGAYGLVASLAGYLLVLRNSVANSAVRAMAAATGSEERARMFSSAAALYAAVGVATGLLIALAALAIAGFILDGDLAADARAGGLGLGALMAAGIPASVYLDGLRAERRIVLGAYRSPATVGRFEGPVRAHNLLYALSGALAVPVVPTASRYVAAGDERRLRELVVRGTRYTLALFVPLCVTLMALAEPILEVWLGARYDGGAAALTILVSYWLLYGGLVVTPGFLVGAGRAREVAHIFIAVAVANLGVALILTPELGLEGPAIATALPFFVAFPAMLRVGLSASGAGLGELARRAWLPAYVLGAGLAAALVTVRLAAEPETLPAVLGGGAGGGVG